MFSTQLHSENVLRKHEGLRLYAYDDDTGKRLKKGDVVKGIVTIGYGRNLGTFGITKDEAEYLFQNDLKRLREKLPKAFPAFKFMSDVRQSVIINMAFNMGLTRLRGFRKMWRAAGHEDWEGVAREIVDSKYGRTHKRRARQLASVMLTGKFKTKR